MIKLKQTAHRLFGEELDGLYRMQSIGGLVLFEWKWKQAVNVLGNCLAIVGLLVGKLGVEYLVANRILSGRSWRKGGKYRACTRSDRQAIKLPFGFPWKSCERHP